MNNILEQSVTNEDQAGQQSMKRVLAIRPKKDIGRLNSSRSIFSVSAQSGAQNPAQKYSNRYRQIYTNINGGHTIKKIPAAMPGFFCLKELVDFSEVLTKCQHGVFTLPSYSF